MKAVEIFKKIVISGLLILVTGVNAQTIYTVTKTGDPDPFDHPYNFNDQLCDPEMYGTLQWAIRKSNDTTGVSEIQFAIPGSGTQTIVLNSYLPSVQKTIILNGTTQPGYNENNDPLVEIDGHLLPENITVLRLALGSDNSVIKGILFKEMHGNIGIAVWGSHITIEKNMFHNVGGTGSSYRCTAISVFSSYNQIKANYLGTDKSEGLISGCSGGNILIQSQSNRADYNIIGPENVIANSIYWGVEVTNGTYNKITENRMNSTTGISLTLQAGSPNWGNNGKTTPIITTADPIGNLLQIRGTAQPNDTIEIFAGTGSNSARKFISSTITDGNGNWGIDSDTTYYTYLIATATDWQNNTSEFSQPKQIVVCNIEADAGQDISVCAGSNVTLNASGGSNFLWSNGETTASINVMPSTTTTYSVTVNEGICSSTDAVLVTVNPLPIADAGEDVTISAGSSATLSANGGSSFLWSTGETSQSIRVSPLVTTTYSVSVTDDNRCSGTDNVVVTISPAQPTSQTITSNLSSIWYISGIVPDWSNQGTVTTDIAPGTYSFITQDAGGSLYPQFSFSVDNNGNFQYSSEVAKFATGAGTKNLNVNGFEISVSSNLSSMWFLTGGLSTDWMAQGTNVAHVLPFENYHFLSQETGGGLYPKFIFAVDNDGKIQYSADVAKFATGAGTSNLAVNGFEISVTSNLSSMWFLTGGLSTEWMTPGTSVAHVLPFENYRFFSQEAGGGLYPQFIFSVTVDDNGKIQYSSDVAKFATGAGTQNLVVNGFEISVTSNLTSMWYLTAGLMTDWMEQGTQVAHVLPFENYRFFSQDAGGGLYPQFIFSVDINGKIQYSTEVAKFATGAGTQNLVVNGFEISVTSNLTSMWYLTAGLMTNWLEQGTQVAHVLPFDNYRFFSQDAGGGLYPQFIFSVDNNGKIQYSTEVANFTTGAGTQNLVVNGFEISVTSNLSSMWYLTGGLMTDWMSHSTQAFQVLPFAGYFYKTRGSLEDVQFNFGVDSDGNINSAPAIITVDNIDYSVSGNGSNTLTVGTISTYPINITSNLSATWGIDGIEPSINAAGTKTFDLAPGQYLFTTSNNFGNSFYFTVGTGGSITAEGCGSFVVCGSKSMVVNGVDLTVTSNLTATWGIYLIEPSTNPEGSSKSFKLLPGNYTYTFTTSNNFGNSFNFNIDPNGVVTSEACSANQPYANCSSPNTLIVNGFNVTIQSYQPCGGTWAIYIVGQNNPVGPLAVNYKLLPGNYTLIANGGFGSSFNFTIDNTGSFANVPGTFYGASVSGNGTQLLSIGSSLTADAGADVSVCAGSSATLTASGGSSFLWSTGETTASINVTPSSTTTYTVTVSEGGCSGTDEVVVTVNPLPVADAGEDKSIDEGICVQIGTTAIDGNNYKWEPSLELSSDNMATINACPIANIEYKLDVSNSYGCHSTDKVNISVKPALINYNLDYQEGRVWFKVKTTLGEELLPYNYGYHIIDHNMLNVFEQFKVKRLFQPFRNDMNQELNLVYEIDFDHNQSVEALISMISSKDFVEYAEKVPLCKIFPTYSNETAFWNDAMQNWHLANVEAPDAWDPTCFGNNVFDLNNDVVIAVVDNEIHLNVNNPPNLGHEDLIPNLWRNTAEINGIGSSDDDGNGYIDDLYGFDAGNYIPSTPVDFNTSDLNINLRHGTHCAGIAAGATNNGFGIASLSANVRLMPIKARSDADDEGAITYGYEGIVYAIKSHADIISLSWGKAFPNTTTSPCLTCEQIINWANSEDIIVIAAAGNDGYDLSSVTVFPAEIPGVITVGSTGAEVAGAFYENVQSPFSNLGAEIDVWAPGFQIYSSYIEIGTNASTYTTLSGTSMATPLVAALAALVKSYNPNLTKDYVIDCIYNGADDIGLTGAHGRINAKNTINCLKTVPESKIRSSSLSACAGASIRFENISTGAMPQTSSWTIVPSTYTSSNLNSNQIDVVFNQPGVYSVTLVTTNSLGTDNIIQQIDINDCPPIHDVNANWYFGLRGAISFASGDAQPQSPSSITSKESCASISDGNGELLFYTDGHFIWDSDHNIVQFCNGSSTTGNAVLNGSPNSIRDDANNGIPAGDPSRISISTSQTLIVPMPNNANRFYVFTVSDSPILSQDPMINNGLCYSIIDINGCGGTSVIELNTPINTNVLIPTTEHLTAIPHCNGVDYWIIVHGAGIVNGTDYTGSFISYLLTSNGIELTQTHVSPTTFSAPDFNTTNMQTYDNIRNQTIASYVGSLEASPDGRWVAASTRVLQGTNYSLGINAGLNLMNPKRHLYLYKFDNANGSLQLVKTFIGEGYTGGMQFDNTSSFLYTFKSIFTSANSSAISKLQQFDLYNLGPNDIHVTDETAAFAPLLGLQMGPNGKIYYTNFRQMGIGAISRPSYQVSANNLNACFANNNTLNLNPGSQGWHNLPNVIDAKPNIADFTFMLLNNNQCRAVRFNAPPCFNTYNWNFGDGTPVIQGVSGQMVSTTTTSGTYDIPVHTFPAAGTYTVVLTLNGTTVITKQIVIPDINMNVSGPAQVCMNDPQLYTISSNNPDASYWWSGADFIGNNNEVTATAFWTTPGNKTLTANATIQSCIINKTLNVMVKPVPEINLGPDISVCNNGTVQITPLTTCDPSYTYQWTPQIGLNDYNICNPVFDASFGNSHYTCHVTNNGCQAEDEIEITIMTTEIVATAEDPIICRGSYTDLTASGGTSYQWSNGASTETISVSPHSSTSYSVIGTDANGCSNSTSVALTVIPTPIITVSGISPICTGTSSVLTASGGDSYTWSTGAMQATINTSPTTTTTYTVSGTAANGCSNTAIFTVNVVNMEMPTFTPLNLCQGDIVLSIDNWNATNGVLYKWDMNNSGPTSLIDHDPSTNTFNYSYINDVPGYHRVHLCSYIPNTTCKARGTQVIQVIPLNIDYNHDYSGQGGCRSEYFQYWDNDNIPYNDIVINSSLSFSSNLNIRSTLRITNNSTLTITTTNPSSPTTIKFGPNGRIVIEPGSKLIIEKNSLLTGFEALMWQGIELWSSTDPSTGVVTRGVMEAKDGLNKIRQAHIGVFVGKKNVCIPYNFGNYFNNPEYIYCKKMYYVNGTGSGTLDLNQLKIENCAIGIFFTPDKLNSTSKINECSFDGGGLSDPGFNPNFTGYGINNYHYDFSMPNPFCYRATSSRGKGAIGIRSETTKNVIITNNTFDDWGNGIESYDSKYDLIGNVFKNLGNGVYISNTTLNPANKHTIYNNPHFDNIRGTAIIIESGSNDVVRFNQFNNSNYAGTIGNAMQLINSVGEKIYDNTITYYRTGIVIVKSSGDAGTGTGYIGPYAAVLSENAPGNNFISCNMGVLTRFDNKKLTITCNYHQNTTLTGYSFTWNNSLGRLANQGVNSNDAYTASGNLFNVSNAQLKKILNSSQQYIYTYHNSSNRIPNFISGVLGNPHNRPYITGVCNKCPSTDCWYAALNEAEQNLQQLNVLKIRLENQADGNGQTQQLLADIESGMAAGQLKNKLVQSYPLSDTVLKTLITTEHQLPPGNFKEVIIPNSPVPEEVTPYLNARLETLPNGIARQIREEQGDFATKNTPGAVSRRIDYWEAQKQQAINDIVNYYIEVSTDSAKMYLEAEGSNLSKQKLVAMELAEENSQVTNTRLAGFNAMNPAESDWKMLAALQLTLQQEGRSYYEMEDAEEQMVRNLAYRSTPSTATLNAQAILRMLYGEEFEFDVPENPPLRMAAAEPEKEIFEGNYYLGQNIPNPTTGKILIPYKLPEGIEKAVIELTDAPGKVIHFWEISSERTVLETDLGGLGKGIYYYSLKVGGTILDVKRMVIIE